MVRDSRRARVARIRRLLQRSRGAAAASVVVHAWLLWIGWAAGISHAFAAEPEMYKDWTILGHGGFTKDVGGGPGFLSISCLEPGAENPVYMPALHVPAKPMVRAKARSDASGPDTAEITEIHIQFDATQGRPATAIILPPKDGLYPVFPAWQNAEAERLKQSTTVSFRYRLPDGDQKTLRFSLMGFTRSLHAAIRYCAPKH